MGRLGPTLRYESEVQLSVKVTTWVWEHSRSRGPARLVLLAIADNAHDDGAQAWPSMRTLVRKTSLAERTVHRAIKQLAAMGELEVDYNAGPGLCNLYRVRMTPAPQTPPSERHPRQSGTPASLTGVPERHRGGVIEAPLPPSERHPEPSIEPSRNRVPPSAGRAATAASITPIPTAQTFVAAYVDAYRGRAGHDPPGRVKGQVAKHLREAFDDGIPADTIKAGFVEWFERDQHPATLPSFIEVAGRGGRPRNSTTRANQQIDQARRTYEEMMANATGPVGPPGGPPQPELARPADHHRDR